MSGTRWWVALLLCGVLVSAGCAGPAQGEPGRDASAYPSGPADTATPADTPTPADTATPGEWRTADCAAARSPQRAAVGGESMLVTPEALEAAIRRIEEAGRARFPDSFAGLSVDQEQVRALVYRVPSDAFDGFLRQVAPGVCVVVRDAVHSARELDRWRERVVADMPTWSGAGLPINTVGARHDGTGVEIGVEDVVRARAEVRRRYGPDAPLVVVHQGPVMPLPMIGKFPEVPPHR